MILASPAIYPSGIGMYASGDTRYSIEISRSPNGSTGWVVIAVLPPGQGSYVDSAPIDGVARYYRARLVEVVAGVITRAGPYRNSAPTNGKPRDLIQIEQRPPSLIQQVVTQPLTDTSSRYRCQAYSSSVVSIPHNTITYPDLDSERFDVGDLHSTSTNKSRITVPGTNYLGVWLLHLQVIWTASAAGEYAIAISKNRTVNFGPQLQNIPAGVANSWMSTSWPYVDPTPGDYWEAQLYQFTTGAAAKNALIELCATHIW